MLKTIRIILALCSIIAVTLLFLDFTGTAARLWPWMAQIQFMPALLSANVVALLIILVGTLVFGRIYCSVICPLGIFQDAVNWVRGHVGPKKRRINRFRYSAAWTKTRLVILTIFAILVILGLTTVLAAAIAGLIEPYSAYGRITSQIFAPAWDGINNLLANWSESQGNYYFYKVTAAISIPVLVVAIVTIVTVVAFAWRGGRDYCNMVCPVGTILGYLAQFSLLKPVIVKDQCVRCGKCARNCKAKCIDAKNHQIDYTRCIDCMDCISVCQEGAIKYKIQGTKYKVQKSGSDPMPNISEASVPGQPPHISEASVPGQPPNISEASVPGQPPHISEASVPSASARVPNSRRSFIIAGAALAATAALKAANATDGGLTALKSKQPPYRRTPIAPAGAQSLKHLKQHCTACQLCIQACPNNVLSANLSIDGFMQPVVDYTKGYCRPDCTICSNICPVGAYHPIDEIEKSSIKVGTAEVNLEACLAATGEAKCGNCARHCPAGAIMMVPVGEGTDNMMPIVNGSICIGCGACEYYCPVGTVASMNESQSAIHVEGLEIHREI
ncbi:MAG: 4Fe-4S binding protein [Bacteroidales bacterium]|nr:4Fe-4S binding protein [Bacteroidales bacterium]